MDDVEEELQQLRNDIADIAKSVHSILSLLKGSDLDNAGGMIQKLHDCEVRLVKVEQFIERIKWVGIGMSIPAGVGVLEIFKILFGAG